MLQSGGATKGVALFDIRRAWSLIREVDLDWLRDGIERPVKTVVAGAPTLQRDAVLAMLDGHQVVGVADLPISPEDQSILDTADLVLLVTERMQLSVAERALVDGLGRMSVAWATVVGRRGVGAGLGAIAVHDDMKDTLDVDLDRPLHAEARIADLIFRLLGARSLSLGRSASRLREPLAERIIGETSAANAQFALQSSLVSLIPVVGGVTAVTSDMLVLTKNQAMMVYKLAGLYGRDVSNWQALAIEIAPVIGSAFLWRSIARSVVGLIPAAASAVPKTAIAYTGTVAVGEIARRYYRDGLRPDGALIRDARHHVVDRFRGNFAGARTAA
ncbi:MAG: hypothetical protein HW416_1660 [Chloroflexi bacterium]|nr:hypothetical protein [Chloroflexota bacterium]